jgi:hypothetical protein
MSNKTPIQKRTSQRNESNSKSTFRWASLAAAGSVAASLGSLLALIDSGSVMTYYNLHEKQKDFHSLPDVATGIAILTLFTIAIRLLLSIINHEDN